MLSISIVVYKLEAQIFQQLLTSLYRALHKIPDDLQPFSIKIIDNGNQEDSIRTSLSSLDINLADMEIISAGSNIGYGRGHNLGIKQSTSRYHLILNPDVVLDENCLARGLDYLEAHPEVCAVAPYTKDNAGNTQYLAKQYPALLDLLVRGFMPVKAQRLFEKRLCEYELRTLVDEGKPAEVEIISGCFMLCRTECLKKVGGFDERYFLYFEDFSLSMELNKIGSLFYLPDMKIIHYGGNTATKGLKHIWYFTVSAIKFFYQYGWKIL